MYIYIYIYIYIYSCIYNVYIHWLDVLLNFDSVEQIIYVQYNSINIEAIFDLHMNHVLWEFSCGLIDLTEVRTS